MTVPQALQQCLFAAIGTLGFCMIFHLRTRRLLIPTIGGALCWAVYLQFMHFHFGIFLSSLFASAFVGVYSEIFSYFEKVPGSIYFIPGCVPLIPGSDLYYAMEAMIANEWGAFRLHLTKLALFAVGISLGLGIVVEINHICLAVKERSVSASAR